MTLESPSRERLGPFVAIRPRGPQALTGGNGDVQPSSPRAALHHVTRLLPEYPFQLLVDQPAPKPSP